MGVTERRQRERAEMRDSIVLSVRNIAATEGWPAVSLRRIADRTEFSSTLLYQYFDSKEDVIFEIRRRGYHELHDRLAAVSAESPQELMRQLARANVNAAFDQPEVFQAMLGMDGAPCGPTEGWTAPAQIAALLEDAIEPLAALHPGTPPESSELAQAWFCSIQGVITMHLIGLFPGGRERALRTADLVSSIALLGLASEVDAYGC